jgi:hypothetical protein
MIFDKYIIEWKYKKEIKLKKYNNFGRMDILVKKSFEK